jgi:nitrogen-specific signal transduction histidine kinase
MDGSLEVESAPGETVFRLVLPAAAERLPERSRDAEGAPAV